MFEVEKAVVGAGGTSGFGRATPHRSDPGTECLWHVGKTRGGALACFKPSCA